MPRVLGSEGDRHRAHCTPGKDEPVHRRYAIRPHGPDASVPRGRPYWRRGAGLLELPVQVTRGARLPFFGTSVTLGGPRLASVLSRMCVGEPLINLELHGIDVLDASDGLEALRPHQADVRVPVARKLASLRAALEELRGAGYEFVTLREAARTLSAAAS